MSELDEARTKLTRLASGTDAYARKARRALAALAPSAPTSAELTAMVTRLTAQIAALSGSTPAKNTPTRPATAARVTNYSGQAAEIDRRMGTVEQKPEVRSENGARVFSAYSSGGLK